MKPQPQQALAMYRELSGWFRSECEALGEVEQTIVVKAIETVNTPLYATLGWFETGSEDVAQQIHTLVRDETMYILFLDKFHETGDETFRGLATKCRERVRAVLTSQQDGQLQVLEGKLFVYWDMEKDLQSRMLERQPISLQDVRAITLRKSTDVYAYAMLMCLRVDLPQTVVQELYAQQLRRDVQDDVDDLGEDAAAHLPNPILLRLLLKGAFDSHESNSQEDLERRANELDCIDEQRALVTQHADTISSDLSESYHWMRDCCNVNMGE